MNLMQNYISHQIEIKFKNKFQNRIQKNCIQKNCIQKNCIRKNCIQKGEKYAADQEWL